MGHAVAIIEHGRDGAVHYRDGSRLIEGYWEFGGGDVVTIVSMGSREDWRRAHAWAVEQRSTILNFVADEVIRQRAPTCNAEIDEDSGQILLRQAPGAVAPPSAARANQVEAAAFVHRLRDLRSKVAVIVLAAAVVVAGVLWLGEKMMTVAPANGIPLNEAVRYGADGAADQAGIAMLIQSTDPHLPRVTGRGGDDSTSVGILLIALDGGKPRLVPVAEKLTVNLSLARIMGSDGQTLWFDVAGLRGVQLRGHDLIGPKELARANPSIDPALWEDQRGMDVVDGKLHVMRADRSGAFDIDPESLIATAVAPKRSKARFRQMDPEDALPADLRIAAERDAFVISRIGSNGDVLWTADTGIYRPKLHQVLPGADLVAFIGERPPIPGKLSEPLVVLVNMDTGKITTHALWSSI